MDSYLIVEITNLTICWETEAGLSMYFSILMMSLLSQDTFFLLLVDFFFEPLIFQQDILSTEKWNFS